MRAMLIGWQVPVSYIVRHDGFGLKWTITVPTSVGVTTLDLDVVHVRVPRGGVRSYLLCRGLPNAWCGQRVTKLYVRPNSPHFACRTCHELTYRSRQTRKHPKWLERLRAEAFRAI